MGTAVDSNLGVLYTHLTDSANPHSTTAAQVGSIAGPTSSTLNAVSKFGDTGGDSLLDSSVVVDASNNITGVASLTVTELVATTTVTTSDNIIILNDDVTGSPNQDAGIEVERGSSTNAQLMWNETSDTWQAGQTGTLADISLSGHTHSYIPGAGTVTADNFVAFSGTGGLTLKDSTYNSSSFATSAHTHTVTDVFTGFIAAGADQHYTIDQKAGFQYTIVTLDIVTSSGTCTAALEIDGTPVTGISAVSVSSSEATGTASAANVVSAANTLELVLSSCSSAVNVAFTIKFTRSV